MSDTAASRPQRTFHDIMAGASIRSRAAITVREWFIKAGLTACGLFSILVTLTIICVLLVEAVSFFSRDEVTIWGFCTGMKWSPLLGSQKLFGIWPLISGTLLVSTVAMTLALPLGVVTAVYLSEYAGARVRAMLKPTLEVLAGIPTVVYGFFALTIITPSLKYFHDGFNVYNALSAGIAVGILCLPTVCSLTEDALQSVPRSLREGAYGLGATKFEVSIRVVIPAALSGIISAFLLAIARAVGETMIVALAAGNMPRMTVDPRQEVQTMTGFMVQMALGDVTSFGIEYASMYAVALVLFTMTMALTVLGHIVRRRFREAYE